MPLFCHWSQMPQPYATPPLGLEVKLHAQSLPHLGLNDRTIAHFGLGLSASSTCLPRRIVFPIHNVTGEVVGYVGRYPRNPVPKRFPKYRLVGDCHQEVLNLHRVLRTSQPVVIVPDYFDVFHLWEKGYEHVVAAVGSDWYAAQVRLILHSLPNHRFIILGDETEYGREWRANTARLFCPFAYTRVLEFSEEGRLVSSLTPLEIKEEI